MEGSEEEEQGKVYTYTLHSVVYKVRVETSTYQSGGRKSISLVTTDGEPFATATVNLPDVELAHDEVCIKAWGANEGMLEFLTKNGIVQDTGRRVPTGFVEALVCKLLIE